MENKIQEAEAQHSSCQCHALSPKKQALMALIGTKAKDIRDPQWEDFEDDILDVCRRYRQGKTRRAQVVYTQVMNID